jgi:hypothetical protein
MSRGSLDFTMQGEYDMRIVGRPTYGFQRRQHGLA